ncbi:MAG: HesA/MoeB/ThiF family protein [Candidatus Heimdallarchaeaceae archaeon]
MLSDKDLKRYVRQIIIPTIGIEGQEKLHSANVLVIGAGGLGSPVLYYLAATGVGHIGIVDKDTVEISNLNRQILHGEKDIGKAKTQSAVETIHWLNPKIEITPYQTELNSDNIHSIVSQYDFIVEASDNFETKFLVNDACVSLKKPFVIGGVYQFEGQMMTVIPGITACYRCVLKQIPEPGTYPTSCESGIMGTTAGFFGLIQANEALKYLLFNDIDRLLTDKMLYGDLQYNVFEIIKVARDSKCESCGSI